MSFRRVAMNLPGAFIAVNGYGSRGLTAAAFCWDASVARGEPRW